MTVDLTYLNRTLVANAPRGRQHNVIMPLPGQYSIENDPSFDIVINMTLPKDAEQTIRFITNSETLNPTTLANRFDLNRGDNLVHVLQYTFNFGSEFTRVNEDEATYGLNLSPNIVPEALFEVDGVFYTVDGSNFPVGNTGLPAQRGRLYTIDIATGLATLVANQPNNFGVNLADIEWATYDQRTDTTWVSGDDVDHFYTLDLTTGQATQGLPTPRNYEFVTSTSSGIFYGLSKSAPNQPTALYQVDPVAGTDELLFLVTQSTSPDVTPSTLTEINENLLFAGGGDAERVFLIDLLRKLVIAIPGITAPNMAFTSVILNPETSDRQIYALDTAGLHILDNSLISTILYKSRSPQDVEISLDINTFTDGGVEIIAENNYQAEQEINSLEDLFPVALYQTERPPLNLFENTSAMLTNEINQIVSAPQYIIPAEPPFEERRVFTNLIVLRTTLTNLNDTESEVVNLLRYDPTKTSFTPVQIGLRVPANSTITVDMNRLLLNSGESLVGHMKTPSGIVVDMDYLVNTTTDWVLDRNGSTGTELNPVVGSIATQPLNGLVNIKAPNQPIQAGTSSQRFGNQNVSQVIIRSSNNSPSTSADSTGGFIYVVDENTEEVYRVNVAERNRTLIGQIGYQSVQTLVNFEGTVFGSSATLSNFFSINIENLRAVNLIGDTSVQILGMAELGGVVYASSGSILYTINTRNARLSNVGSMGVSSINSLAALNGVLYGATSSGQLYSFDTSTGTGTSIGQINRLTNVGGMTALNNTLYVGSTTGNTLYTVDVTSLVSRSLGNLNLGTPGALVVA